MSVSNDSTQTETATTHQCIQDADDDGEGGWSGYPSDSQRTVLQKKLYVAYSEARDQTAEVSDPEATSPISSRTRSRSSKKRAIVQGEDVAEDPVSGDEYETLEEDGGGRVSGVFTDIEIDDLEWLFCLKSVFGSASNGLAYSGFQKKVSGNLHSYAYTFSCKNVAHGTQFPVVYGLCRYSRGFSREGSSNESVVVEYGDFRFFRPLSSKHFTHMATRQLSRDATVDDLGHISRSLDCFTSNFS